MTVGDFRGEAARVIARHAELEREAVERMLTVPPKPDMGDFAFPCFTLAKKWRKAPPLIAQEIAEKASGDLDLLCGAQALGGYVNLSVDRARFADAVLREATSAGEAYGRCEDGAGQTIAIDYSSPEHRQTLPRGPPALHHHRRRAGADLRGTGLQGHRHQPRGRLGHPVRPADRGAQEVRAARRRKRPDEPQPPLRQVPRGGGQRPGAGGGGAGMVPPAGGGGRGGAGSVAQYPGHQPRLLQADLRTARRALRLIHRRVVFNDKMDVVIEEARAKGLAEVSDGALIIDLSEEGIDTPALLEKATARRFTSPGT